MSERIAWRLAAIGLALLALPQAAGCGKGVPYKTVPVSGKVTYDDGTPIPAAQIVVYFYPQVEAVDKKAPPKVGSAQVNVADGTFGEASTWEIGDGVIPGTAKVVVQSRDEQERWTNAVPAAYRDQQTTPLSVEIRKGMEPLVLTVKKK